MYKLGRGNRDKVQQFMTITGASEKVALQALKASDWHLEGAFDFFYSQPQVSVVNTRHLEDIFNRYKEPYADMIMVEGISQFCNDLQVRSIYFHLNEALWLVTPEDIPAAETEDIPAAEAERAAGWNLSPKVSAEYTNCTTKPRLGEMLKLNEKLEAEIQN
ncbi:hypothetical protein ACJX0J_042067, partial [Zea mays]